jgi:hypothetical protein
MGGLFHDAQLEARKRALVAESEVYRQILQLECYNLRLYSTKVGHQFSNLKYLLLIGVPLVSALLQFRRVRAKPRRRGLLGFLGKVLVGWRLYRKYGGLMRSFFGPRYGAKAGRSAANLASLARM